LLKANDGLKDEDMSNAAWTGAQWQFTLSGNH
jgi:hypothetical protein